MKINLKYTPIITREYPKGKNAIENMPKIRRNVISKNKEPKIEKVTRKNEK